MTLTRANFDPIQFLTGGLGGTLWADPGPSRVPAGDEINPEFEALLAEDAPDLFDVEPPQAPSLPELPAGEAGSILNTLTANFVNRPEGGPITGPWRAGKNQPEAPGNPASTGHAGHVPAGAAGTAPDSTGAGQGTKIRRVYGAAHEG